MLYTLDAEDLLLKLDPEFFPEDAGLPVNVSLNVEAKCCGFAGRAVMDVGLRDLRRFAADLGRLYDSLSGAAVLTEPYGPGFLSFSARQRGAILVRGYLRQQRPGLPDQELRFAECVEPGSLGPLASRLRKELMELPESRCS